jgi:chloride channel protein, CIC family
MRAGVSAQAHRGGSAGSAGDDALGRDEDATIKTPPPPPARPLSVQALYLLSVAIGAIIGLGAVLFRGLIGLFHNLLFLGQLSWLYDANLHTPASPWGAGVVAVPVVGALGVAFLVQKFAPEAKGHGVPEVVDAIYYNRGVIRPIVVLIKSLASALSIGSGGAVGREGPIMQIGSAFGSSAGQLLRVPFWQQVTLIAAGAAGGIAATFNTPVGGVLFAVEIMMSEVSARTLVPVTISAATATYVGRIFFGSHPSFVIPALETANFELMSASALLAFVGLGVLMGLVSVVYIRAIYAFEDFFERLHTSYYVRHAGGMLVVGILFYVLFRTTGHYHIAGIGYATVQDVLTGALNATPLLLVLFVLKLFATSLTLGSGASGGIFSPALFMGATLGAAYAVAAGGVFPQLALSPAAFAVAGMAGLVGGSTGAAMAAIVMIFEMTLDYNVIIPMTITVALSYGVRNRFCAESIYSLKLARRGHNVPESLRTNLHELRRAEDLMETAHATLPASSEPDDAAQILAERTDVSWFLVVDAGRVVGVLTRADALAALGQRSHGATLGAIARRDWLRVSPGAHLADILRGMRTHGAAYALVVDGPEPSAPDAVRGLITKVGIADAFAQMSELYAA